MIKLAISTALLVLLAGPSAYALQEPEKEKDKPAQQEEKKPEEKKQEPERKPEEKKPQEKPQPQEKEQNDRAKQTDKQGQDTTKQKQQAAKQQQQTEKERAQQNKTTQEHAQQAQHQDQHNVQQAQHENAPANHNNARPIKEEDFRAHFGQQHAFRVTRRDDRRFNYSGYWFTYNDAWPSAWSYDDNVYVDETDGEYYLIDPVHPGLRLLVVVSG